MFEAAKPTTRQSENLTKTNWVEKDQKVHCVAVEDSDASYSGTLKFVNQAFTNVRITLENGEKIDPVCVSSFSVPTFTNILLRCIPLGYHVLKLTDARKKVSTLFLFVHPGRCYLPTVSKPETALIIQLYAVRSDNNWGIGSYTDLGDILKSASGPYSYIGINPLHAMTPLSPEAASPYAPDSRLLFNEIYIDVEAAARRCCRENVLTRIAAVGDSAQVKRLRNEVHVRYREVYAIKLRCLEIVFRSLLGDDYQFSKISSDFANYIAEMSAMMIKAVVARARQRNWRSIGDRGKQCLFEFFLQWLCDEQIRDAQEGSDCKLYLDLAIGCKLGGTDHLITDGVFDASKTLGAPPDEFCKDGQKWNVAPLSISELRKTGYEYFIEILRKNMMIDGAIRIDHIIGFSRRFTMLLSEDPSFGTYEDIPLKEFLAMLAIESHRQRCIVIGEDLGVVPVGLRAEMQRHNVLGCVVYLLENDGKTLEAVEIDRQRTSLFSFGTHDCIPMCGYFAGRDIILNEQIGREGIIDFGSELSKRTNLQKTMFADQDLDQNVQADRIEALNLLADKIGGRINAFSLDDILGEIDPVNLPGTDAEYPNWRRKYARKFHI